MNFLLSCFSLLNSQNHRLGYSWVGSLPRVRQKESDVQYMTLVSQYLYIQEVKLVTHGATDMAEKQE